MKTRELMQEFIIETENPIDVVAEIAIENNLQFSRPTFDELHMTVDGRHSAYKIYFVWQEEFRAIQFCCEMDLIVEDHQRLVFADFAMGINQKLWLGHFDLISAENAPCFRYTLMVRHESFEEQIADLIEYAVAESNRFFPVFEMVSAGDSRARDILEATIVEPVGEA